MKRFSTRPGVTARAQLSGRYNWYAGDGLLGGQRQADRHRSFPACAVARSTRVTPTECVPYGEDGVVDDIGAQRMFASLEGSN